MQANGQFSISVNPDSLLQATMMAFVPGDLPLTRPVDGMSGARSVEEKGSPVAHAPKRAVFALLRTPLNELQAFT